nr:MAG TPA: hypothetical protein [Caudoviricetes sp.]
MQVFFYYIKFFILVPIIFYSIYGPKKIIKKSRSS